MPLLVVTGATGFIGRHVTAVAERSGWRVRTTGRKPATMHPGTEHVTADLESPSGWDRALEGAHAVVHCAHALEGDPATLHAVNVEGTERVAAAADRNNVPVRGMVSTAAIHGHRVTTPVDENAPFAPESDLSVSRAEADQRWLATGGFTVRPAYVIGPGDRWVIPQLAGLAAQGVALDRPNSVIHADDLAETIIRLLGKRATGPYNVAWPTTCTGQQLLDAAGLPSRGTGEPTERARALAAASLVLNVDRVTAELDGLGFMRHDPTVPDTETRDWYRTASTKV